MRASRSDLRFAGMISAGMIATVVTIGILLSPVLAWHDNRVHNARDHSQTLRLPDLPLDAATAPAPAMSLAADRRGHDRAASVRKALHLGDAAAPRTTGGGTVTLGGSAIKLPHRTAPLATKSTDTDGDGMPDAWERHYGLNPDDASDATEDTDGDGLDNRTERRTRTKPTRSDSDRNGVADGDEDTDHDGLRNSIEIEAGADPAAADSNGDGISDDQDDPDGDGVSNIVEQAAGTDPGSSQDVPPVVTEEPTPAVTPDPADDVQDGGADPGTPPAPDTPDQPTDEPPAPAPVPDPDIPTPADPVPDQPAPDPTPTPSPDPTPAPTEDPAPTPTPTPVPVETPAQSSAIPVATSQSDQPT